jgi:hypothetical protein
MVEIPALWTDLTDDQRDEGLAYVGGVFYQAALRMPHGQCYRVTYARDSSLRCDWCQCPIGRNHNHLKTDVALVGARAMCFECAEQEYYLLVEEVAPEFDDGDWDDWRVTTSPPPFLAAKRIPKEVLNP